MNNNLSNYYDKLDEVFPSSQMTEVAREAAIHDFTQYTRTNRLSVDAAIAELSDPERVRHFIEIGEKAESYYAGEAPRVDHTAVIADLYESVSFLKDNVVDFIAVGKRTNEILSRVEKAAGETNETAAESKKILGEVHSVAGELKQNIRHAIDTTQDIVQRLDKIPARLDTQLQKMEGLEKGITLATEEAKKATGAAETAAERVEPKRTRSENIKMMLHSVAWGTIASTLCGAGFGALVTHYSGQDKICKDTETRVETKIIERVTSPPESFILRDKHGKKIYILEAAPTPEKPKDSGAKSPAAGTGQPTRAAPLKRAAKPSVSIPR